MNRRNPRIYNAFMTDRERIIGVDFSGAADAGRRIWLAEGPWRDRCVRVDHLRQARELPGSGTELDQALPALKRHLAGQTRALVGLDFPFSLPAPCLAGRSWQVLIKQFAKAFPTPEDLREKCRSRCGGKELKRKTDRLAQTPMSPFNLRLYRQTWHGLAQLLGPLVAADEACVPPFHPPRPDVPWLIEICPASTLKALSARLGQDLYRPYKGTGQPHRRQRAFLLAEIEKLGRARLGRWALRKAVIDDAGGDALDAVIACHAAADALARGLADPPVDQPDVAVEGWVYV